MKKFLFIVLPFLFNTALAQTADQSPVLVIHGGAGTILRQNMTPEKENAYIAGLAEALKKGYGILKSGGSAVDAVETVVKSLEDNPLFNAGKGGGIYQ